MTMRWRDLLDHVGIAWTDHGRNVAAGWIAVACPWCGASDPSKHLGINEQFGHYRCLRNPAHKGRSAPFLLSHLLKTYPLKAPAPGRHSVSDLLKHFASGQPSHRLAGPARGLQSHSPLARRWNSFKPAEHDQQACAYLAERGFWNPARTARLFDLRVGAGRWAQRLWFPLTLAGAVIGFTGRAMQADRQPRYLTETEESVLYIPQSADHNYKVGLLVEGPIDALRLADIAQKRYNLFVAALCGLSVTGTKRMQLLAALRSIPARFVVLDNSVELNAIVRLKKELPMQFAHLRLPQGLDDPAEMTNGEIETWLNTTGIASLAR